MKLSNFAGLSLAALGMVAMASGVNAQTFTYTSSNTATGSTVSSPSTGNIMGNAGAYFVDTPGQATTASSTPTNIRPFTITPQGTGGTATFSVPFDVTVDITSGGSTVPFVFTGFHLSGTLDNTGAKADTVVFDTLNSSAITHSVDGSKFTLQLNGFTPPGLTGSTTSDGTLSFRVISSSTTPEPGAVAMLVGMGISGSAFAFRRVRRSK